MQPTRLPLQIQIKNEDVAVVSAVLSGFSVCAEVYALRQRTLQHEQEQEVEEEEDLSGEGKYKN
jgi:hypothetical protein